MKVDYRNQLKAGKKLVIVTWTDKTSMPQCTSPADVNAFAPHTCLKTVGWVVRETYKVLTISSNIGKNNYSHTTSILKVNILDIREIS